MEVVRSIPILFLPNTDNYEASFEALLKSDCGAIFVLATVRSPAAEYIRTFSNKKDVGKAIILAESMQEISEVNVFNWFIRRLGEEFEIAGIMDSNFSPDKEFCSDIISRMEDVDIAYGIPTFFRTAKVPFLPSGGWKQFIEQHPELKVI